MDKVILAVIAAMNQNNEATADAFDHTWATQRIIAERLVMLQEQVVALQNEIEEIKADLPPHITE